MKRFKRFIISLLIPTLILLAFYGFVSFILWRMPILSEDERIIFRLIWLVAFLLTFISIEFDKAK